MSFWQILQVGTEFEGRLAENIKKYRRNRK
jgi:hypothetical protein